MTALRSLLSAQKIIGNKHSRTLIYQGGYGSGKSTAGALFVIERALTCAPGAIIGAVAPTYQMLQRVVIDALIRECGVLGIECVHLVSRREIIIGNARIQLASADKPKTLAGPNWVCAWCDEAAQFSQEAIDQVNARLRSDLVKQQQLFLTTTPEGLRTHVQVLIREAETWTTAHPGVPCPTCVVIAPTWSNHHLPSDYIRHMRDVQYANDPAGFMNYLRGIAQDSSGSIYTNLKAANEQPCTDNRGALCVLGWDFNIKWMATTVSWWFPHRSVLHFAGEYITRTASQTTTEEHAAGVVEYLLRNGYAAKWQGKMVNADGSQVAACIDASGAGHHASAAWTDEVAVRNAGFLTKHQGRNPRVKDRINTVQHALATRQVLFDPQKAPETLRAFREHSYDSHGEPQKTWATKAFQCDHYTDAGGYAVCTHLPMRRTPYAPDARFSFQRSA